ncbi:hypothetical protein LCGC14_2399530 [marine sediment metagenome]|uniref:DUF504 domain-containing protein n=1 Tax=marine sediment metagenome TaxID=412755 RepID=A0A0F9BVV2_9ZZZZ
MSYEKNEFGDFVAFLDDTDTKRELWVKVIEINSFVRFKLKSGKIISIPSHRVLKVKQEGEK